MHGRQRRLRLYLWWQVYTTKRHVLCLSCTRLPNVSCCTFVYCLSAGREIEFRALRVSCSSARLDNTLEDVFSQEDLSHACGNLSESQRKFATY